MKSRRQAFFLIVPCLLLLGGLVLLPQILMFGASLGRRSAYGGVVSDWNVENYIRAIEPLYLQILGKSFVLAGLTTGLCLLLGYPVALWLGLRVKEQWRNALVVAVILPFWTSLLVRMYAWIFILRDEGLLNATLASLGLPRLPLLYNDFAVLVGQVYGELPFMILPLYLSVSKLDRAVLEAAADLGATPWKTLCKVTVPLTAPGIAAGSVLVFIPSLGAFLAPDLLGGGKTMYVGNLIQSQFAVARNMPFGAALSFLLSVTVLALLYFFRKPLRAAEEI